MNRNPRLSKIRRRIIGILMCLFLLMVLGISAWTAYTTKSLIKADLTTYHDTFTEKEVSEYRKIDPECIMVLGAAVYSDGTPSPMLKDRLDTGIALYKSGVAPKLLFTGDNGQEEYNEVDAMLHYALDRNVPKEDIFLDHAGFSTYESVYRANYIFRVRRMVVVTQTYHLFRALYACRSMGIEALGAGADQEQYKGKEMREIREILARDKDWLKWKIKPEPTFLGERIPITGDGSETQ